MFSGLAATPKSLVKGLMGFFSSTPPLVTGQKLAIELESEIRNKKEEIQAKAKTESDMGDETSKASKGKDKGKGKVVKSKVSKASKTGDAEMDLVTELAKNNKTSKDDIEAKISEIAEKELTQEYEEDRIREILEDPSEETVDVTASNMHEGVTGLKLVLPGDLDLLVTETPKLNAVSTMLEDVLFENEKCDREIDALLPDIFAECNQHIMTKLAEARDILVANRDNIDVFRATCVDEVREECRAMLQHCFPAASDNFTDAVTDAVTDGVVSSWLCELNLPDPDPTSNPRRPGILDSTNEIFFKRVTASIAASRANCLFCSPEWTAYKASETKRERDQVRSHYVAYDGGPPPPPPPGGGPPSLPPNFPLRGPPPGNDPEPFYYHANIPPYRYVVGPILDFENNLEGRTFIYIKCYDDNSYTNGFYFWVYLSQSEGLFRVFFKLQANSIIEKGYDYTQATLVDFRLQRVLCSYYKKHYNRGKRNPIYVDNSFLLFF